MKTILIKSDINTSDNIQAEASVDETSFTFHLSHYKSVVEDCYAQMQEEDFCSRFWKKDISLWKKENSDNRYASFPLGWLDVIEKMMDAIPEINRFTREIKSSGFQEIVLIGMGGSSLAPMVFNESFFSHENGIPFKILDTTDPDFILNVEESLNLEKTLFIISSKSGATTEVVALYNYFFNKMILLKGEQAGRNFIAITDPKTPLAELAETSGFLHVFYNFSDIGGRFSALSYFGMIPAALMGVDITKFLKSAEFMANDCRAELHVSQNPGFSLGVILAELSLQGRDKLVLVIPEPLAFFGNWLEQLIAESTGKEGVGILPILDNELNNPELYNSDCVFVYISLSNQCNKIIEKKLIALKEKGHPTLRILLNDIYNLGQEFFRWELATAAMGAVLNINPFDQPNVQENKDITDHLLNILDTQGVLPDEKPLFFENPLSYFSTENAHNGQLLLKTFFDNKHPDGYVCIQAYLPENPGIKKMLESIKNYLQDFVKLPVKVEFGPRYLHSTGQYHKAGPNTGLFIQLTSSSIRNIAVPERSFTFEQLKNAQAFGDVEALKNHNRKVIHIDLGHNIPNGLLKLMAQIEALTFESSRISVFP